MSLQRKGYMKRGTKPLRARHGLRSQSAPGRYAPLDQGCGHRKFSSDRADVIIAGRRAADGRPRTEIDWAKEWCRDCGTWKLVTIRGGKGAPQRGLAPGRDNGPSDEVRRLVLERDAYSCVCCGRYLAGERYSLGHRLRASQGGQATPSNLLTFRGWGGEACHGRIDSRSDPCDEARGLTVRSHQDPALVRVTLFDGRKVWLWDDGQYHDAPMAEAA